MTQHYLLFFSKHVKAHVDFHGSNNARKSPALTCFIEKSYLMLFFLATEIREVDSQCPE